MIELGTLLIDEETAVAFREWLDTLVAARRKRLATIEHEAAQDALDAKRYEKVCELARKTARVNGIIEGLSTAYAAEATWDAFVACEGWYSPYDVDDYFEVRAEPAHYCEAWLLSYAEEIDKMKQEKKAA